LPPCIVSIIHYPLKFTIYFVGHGEPLTGCTASVLPRQQISRSRFFVEIQPQMRYNVEYAGLEVRRPTGLFVK
jgi:hypothetical protein